ncbi:hypothetical protein CH373_09635 [Leptospira perolatii]|uniref:SGNH hydrolase-type esterase domain-containing protein n=1 Tax=Leptospira perolatii TaxID=2023191 RepID=A0A2M9ZMC6_9LEPT|nr:SGNH/GDSL hydrolase family protein [Leptospira perolatii]PJZ70050.1 hypothetical protein CH360_07380 [Leptospira perolatii]PJZ73238.1 hypothetical protein CH373_09635 [Leptospira perolatii]
MKVLLIALLFVFCSCSFGKEEKRICDPIQYLTAYSHDSCRTIYGGEAARNPAYYAEDYFCRIVNDFQEYKVIVGQDSSMDLARKYPGFYNPLTTQFVAVSSNTTCDMIEQISNIHSSKPEAIIYSTNGGNDLAWNLPSKIVVDTFKKLVQITRNRWPLAKLVVIGVHPSFAPYGNDRKDEVNHAVQEFLSEQPNTCYIDPLPFFGVKEKERPPLNLMRDPLHYNSFVSFEIKSAISSSCGVDF